MSGNQTYAKRYFEAALDFFEKGDYGKAVEHINKAIDKAPSDAEIISTKGVFLHKMNDLAGAIDAYRAAIRVAPNHQFSHFNLGLIHMKTGNVTPAIQEWECVIRLNPNDIDALFNVAVALAQMGKQPEAMMFYQRVLKLNSGHVQTHQNLGLIYRDAHDFEKAKFHLKRLKELDSTYSEVVNREIIRCEEQEFIEKLTASNTGKDAPENLAKAGSITARTHAALMACLSGNYSTSLELAEGILKESPLDLQARLIRGQALVGLSRYSDAIAEFMAVSVSNPEEPDPFFHLGAIFFSMNELEKALEYFQSVLKIEPNYSLVKENIANIESKIKESKLKKPGAKSK